MEAPPASDPEDAWEKFKIQVEAFKRIVAAYKTLTKNTSEVVTQSYQCLECWELVAKFKFETLPEVDLKRAIDEIYEPTVTFIMVFAWFNACTTNNNKHFIPLTERMKTCFDFISGEAGAKGLKLQRQRLLQLTPFIAANPWKGPKYMMHITSPKSTKAQVDTAVEELFKRENDVMILKRLAILRSMLIFMKYDAKDQKKYDKLDQVAYTVYAWADNAFAADESNDRFRDEKQWCDKNFCGDVAVIWLAGAASLAMSIYEADKAKPPDPLKPKKVSPPRFKQENGIIAANVMEALNRLKITKSSPCSLIAHWPCYASLYDNILVTGVSTILLDGSNLDGELSHNLLEEWINIYRDSPDSEFSPLNIFNDVDITKIPSSSFYSIASILFKQKRLGDGFRVFVQGILCDINRMDAIYIADDKRQQEEAWKAVRMQLAKKFEQLLDMLPSRSLKKEVVLTLFSLNPTSELLDKLFSSDLKVTQEYASADLKNIKVVLDSHEVELDEWNIYDLLTVIRKPRDQLLNWTSSDEHEQEHRKVCENYLSTGGKSIIRNDELKNLDIDYTQFKGMPREVLTWDDCVEPGFGLGDKRRRKLLARTKGKLPKKKNGICSTKPKPVRKRISVKKLQNKSGNSRVGITVESKRRKPSATNHRTRTGRPTFTKARAKELEREQRKATFPQVKLGCLGLEDDIPPPLSPVGLTGATISVSLGKFYNLVMRETPDQATVNLEPEDACHLTNPQSFISNSDSVYNYLKEANLEDLKGQGRRTTLKNKLIEALRKEIAKPSPINPLYVQPKLGCAVKLVRVIPDSLVKKFAQSLSFDVLIEIIKESLEEMEISFHGKSPTDLKSIISESQQSGRPLFSPLVEQKILQAGASSQTFQLSRPTVHHMDYVADMSKETIRKQCGPKKITTERYERAIIDAACDNLDKNLVLKRAALGLEFVDGKLIRASPLPFVEMPEILETPCSETGLCRVRVLPVAEVLRQHAETKSKDTSSTSQLSTHDQKGFDGRIRSEPHHTPPVMSLVEQIVHMVYNIEDDFYGHPDDSSERGNLSHLQRFLRDAMIWQNKVASEVSQREMPVLIPEDVQVNSEKIPKPRRRKKTSEPKEPKTLQSNGRWGGKAKLLAETPKQLPQTVQVLRRTQTGSTKVNLLPVLNQSAEVVPPCVPNSSLSIPVSVIQSREPAPQTTQTQTLATDYPLPLPHFDTVFSNHTISRCHDYPVGNYYSSSYLNGHLPDSQCYETPNGVANHILMTPHASNVIPSSDVRSLSSNMKIPYESQPSIHSLDQSPEVFSDAAKFSQVQQAVSRDSSPVVKVAEYVPVIQKSPIMRKEDVGSQPSSVGLKCVADQIEGNGDKIQNEYGRVQTETREMIAVLEQNASVQNVSCHDSEPLESFDNPSTPDSDVSYAPSSVNVSGSGGTATTEFSTEEENTQERKPVRRRKRVRNSSVSNRKKSKPSPKGEVSEKVGNAVVEKTMNRAQGPTAADLQNCSVLVKPTDFVVHGATASKSVEVEVANQQRKTLLSPHAIDVTKRITSPTRKKQLVSRTRGKKSRRKNDSSETEDSVSTPPPVIDLISDEGSNQANKSEGETPELHPEIDAAEMFPTNMVNYTAEKAVNSTKNPTDTKDIGTLLCSEELSESTGASDAEAALLSLLKLPEAVGQQDGQAQSHRQIHVKLCETPGETPEAFEEATEERREERTTTRNTSNHNPSAFSISSEVDATNDSHNKLIISPQKSEHVCTGTIVELCNPTRESAGDEKEPSILGETTDEVPMSTIGYDRDDSNEALDDPLGDDTIAGGVGTSDQMKHLFNDQAQQIESEKQMTSLSSQHPDEGQYQVEYDNSSAPENRSTVTSSQLHISEGHLHGVISNAFDNLAHPVPLAIMHAACTASQAASNRPIGNMHSNSKTEANLVSSISDIQNTGVDGDENAELLVSGALSVRSGTDFQSAREHEPVTTSYPIGVEQEVLRLEVEMPADQNDINFSNMNTADISPSLPSVSCDENDATSSCSDGEHLLSACETTEDSSTAGNDEDPLETKTSNFVPEQADGDIVAEGRQVSFSGQQPGIESQNNAYDAQALIDILETDHVEPPELQLSSEAKSAPRLSGSRKRKGEPVKSLPCLSTSLVTCPLPSKTRTSLRKEVQITAEIKSPARNRSLRRIDPAANIEKASRHKRSAKPPKKFDGYEVGQPKRRRNRSLESPPASQGRAASTGTPSPEPRAKHIRQRQSEPNISTRRQKVSSEQPVKVDNSIVFALSDDSNMSQSTVTQQVTKRPAKDQRAITARVRRTSDRQAVLEPELLLPEIGRKIVTGFEVSHESRRESNEVLMVSSAGVFDSENTASDAGLSARLQSNSKPAATSSFTVRPEMTRKLSHDSSSYPSEVESMDTEDEMHATVESFPLVDDSAVTEGSPPRLSPFKKRVRSRQRSKRNNVSIDYETVDLTVEDDNAEPPVLERFDEHDAKHKT